MPERARLPLAGVQRALNRNALEGVEQQRPKVVSGFDLDRAGGYLATWTRASSEILTLPHRVRAFSPDGAALLGNSHVLLNEEVHDQTSGSIAGLGQYLIPRVGVSTRPAVYGSDEYNLGAFFRDTFGNQGDLNRVSGLSFSEGAAGGNVVADTYRILAIFQAPTVNGLLSYQTITEDYTVSADIADLTITVDTVLPQGYRARMFLWKTSYSTDDEPSMFDVAAGTDRNLNLGGIVSDGTTITVTLTDTRDSTLTTPTTNALVAFGGTIVESHYERIWGVGSDTVFVGPFSAGLTADEYFKWQASEEGHALDTPDSATLDGITSELSVVVNYNEGIQWSTGGGEATSRDKYSTTYSDSGSSFTGSGSAVDSAGHLWVLRGDRDLFEFDTDFETELNHYTLSRPAAFSLSVSPIDIGADGSSKLYVFWAAASSGTGEWGVTQYNLSAVEQWTYQESASGLDGPGWGRMAVDSSGNSYFQKDPGTSSYDRTTVVKVDSTGSKVWDASHGSGTTDYDPRDIAVNDAGTLIVSMTEANIRAWNAAGTTQWTTTIESAYVSHANCVITFDSNGNIVFSRRSQTGGEARVRKLDSSDGSTIETSAALGDSVVNAIAEDSAGFFYAAQRSGDELRKFSFANGVEWTVTMSSTSTVPKGAHILDVDTLSVAYSNSVDGYSISDAWYFPFAKRGTQHEVGLKAIKTPDGSESAKFYAKVDDIELEVGSAIPNGNGNTTFTSLASFFSRRNVQFSIDLADGTSSAVSVTVSDVDGNTDFTRTASVLSDWPASFTATNADLEVLGYYPGLAGLTGEVQHSAFFVEWYDDDSATTVEAKADADDFSAGSSTFTSSATGEEWTIDLVDGNVYGGLANLTTALPPKDTVVFSEIGHVNFATYFDYIHLDFQMSPNGVTAIASTPAGLMVFGDNETFLFRGDPDSTSFQIQKSFGVFGCDVGVTPGRLGGVIFPIWNGRIYSVALGMGDVDFGSGLEDISDPVFDPQDPFVQVVGEPRTREVIARTESGVVLRYSPQRQAWFTDVWSEASGFTRLLPYPDKDGTRYVVNDKLFLVEEGAGSPFVTWEHVDLGDKNQRLMWRRAYVYTNDEYAGVPELEFDTGLTTGTLTGREEGPGEFSFTFPHGTVAPKLREATVTMKGASLGDSMEGPVEIEIVPRYRRR